MKKKALWLVGSAFLCMLWMSPIQMQALEWEGSAEIFGAHRKDRITTLIKAFDPPDVFILSDNLVAKNIHVIEGGLRGKVGLCNGVFLKGFGSLGKIDHGLYAESVRDFGDDKVMSRAVIHHGNVHDWSVGLGYQYDFNACVRAGISAGWAYDAQSIRMSHGFFKVPVQKTLPAQTPNSSAQGKKASGKKKTPSAKEEVITVYEQEPNPVLNGLRYKTRWDGPWAGVETRVFLPYVTVDLGYEYHWVHWRAAWNLHGADVIDGAFSDRRKSNHSWGNIGFINVTYNFFDCWTVAIGGRYQYYRATDGHAKPKAGSFAAVGLNDTEVDKVSKATWQSMAMQLFVGYNF